MTTEWGQVNESCVSAGCCPLRRRAWKGEAAGIVQMSDCRCNSEALGLNQRPGVRLQEGRVIRNVLVIVYLVVGVVVANSHHYFTHLTSLKPVLSAVLAVPLWPLVLVGVSLHLK